MQADKINLLVFMREYPVGMAGTKRVQHLVNYLVLHKIKINILAFRSINKTAAKEGENNSVHFFNIGAGTDFKFTHLPGVIKYYINGFHIIAKLKKKACSNIIYNYGGINIENFLFIFWAKVLGFKLIFSMEEDYTFFKDEIKFISRIKSWTISKLDFLNYRWGEAIVAISHHLRDKCITHKAKKVILVPITAELNYDKNKTHFNSPLQVVYSGTFADKDGVNDIIEGFRQFNNHYKDARLILTGQSAQQLDYKREYKNQSNIVFLGFVPDSEFYSLLRNADVLCMCRIESGFANAGFPFKLGEYLATGNPVICSKVSDVEYYLTDSDAYLIDPGNSNQIAASLDEIVRSPSKAREKGLNGMKKCADFFSPEINGKLFYDLIIEIAG